MTKSVPAKLFLSSLLFLAFTCFSFGDAKTPLLLQTPTISKNQIAFVYGGDIWIVGREGGEARRLVTGRDLESGPIFSPDGSMVAFSGNYDSNVDVYVVPSAGGEPRRLTYHPGAQMLPLDGLPMARVSSSIPIAIAPTTRTNSSLFR